MLPAVALLFGAASEICRVLFAHGNTSPADAEVIAQVLRVFALALTPFAVLQLLQRGFYALADTKTPALIAIFSTTVGAVSAWILSLVLATPHILLGVAAAQGISWSIGCVISIVLLRRRLGRLGGREIVTLTVKAGVAGLTTLTVAELAHIVVVPHLGQSFLPSALVLVLVGVIGGGAFLVSAALLRVREVNQVIGMVRRKLGR
jgi:putative peptidoglycan lipid II flippase